MFGNNAKNALHTKGCLEENEMPHIGNNALSCLKTESSIM